MTKIEKEKLQQKFFQLRAIEGKSLREIEREIGVTAKTLCEWSKEMELQLNAMADYRDEELAKKLKFTQFEKNKILGELHLRVTDELGRRDIYELPTIDLIKLLFLLQSKLNGPKQIRMLETSAAFILDDLERVDAIPAC